MVKISLGLGIFAHSLAGSPQKSWQPLEAHAANVAEMAAAFARPFASQAWARLLGELHDLGKARRSFQAYLSRANGLADADYDASEHSHSGAGACWATRKLGAAGRILAYCVAGHHAGLPDWIGGETPNGALAARLAEEVGVLDDPNVKAYVAAHEAAWRRRIVTRIVMVRADVLADARVFSQFMMSGAG